MTGWEPAAGADRPMVADWISFHTYATSVPALQPVLESVVAPFVAGLSEHGALVRWFFIRYRDQNGPHVRLRVGGPLDLLADVQRHGLVELADVRVRLYAPEYDKFGGPGGVAAAERLFHAASEAALGCFGPDYWPLRIATAALHLTEVTDRLPRASRVAFLADSAAYWIGQVGLTSTAVDRLAVPFRRALNATLPVVRADARIRDSMQRYATTLREELPPTGTDLLAQHVHLMNNRLGLTLLEESLLFHAHGG
ncbi:thiopeptide-type bacteriocin biosynthesis protein [Micromonospora sp. NPDC048170]|uniref:thiopeptide-type bacteriocin biosynthesis protein n=1 Tax=Micromonospora sp. NPDC048170 TaxID=3154819 RepID=UPI0033EE137B